MSVRLVVDATCDMPKEFEKYVEILPMYIYMNNKSFRTDEINLDEFNKFLSNGKDVPKTSQSSPKIIVDTIRKLDKNDDIIILTISKKVSGQYNSVRLATNILKDYKITVVDSESLSIQHGIIAIKVIDAIKKGKSKDEILELIDDLKKRVKAIGVLKSLDYLQKGGRIGKLKMLTGKLFGIQPVVTIKDGVLDTYGKNVRGEKNIVPFVLNEIKNINPETIIIAHNDEKNEFDAIKKYLHEKFDCKIYEADINPIILTHGGPKLFFICWIEKNQK